MSKKLDRSPREDFTFPQRRRTPSFSSSLLDSIYRSIDESNGHHQDELNFYRETTTTTTTMIKQQSNARVNRDNTSLQLERDVSNLRKAIMIDSWMEKQSSSSRGSTKFFTTSSSSDSSSVGVLSSSEESCYREKSRPCYEFSRQRSKQVRSDKCLHFDHQQRNVDNKQQPKQPKREGGGFSKTKLKALKIYGELKKVKQPILPGGRIASFLNSIFNSGSNAKKVAMCSVGAMDDVSYNERKSKSNCSSTTSFSRSCLSRTPPSSRASNKYVNGIKRSVRFYPVGVIVDEDSRPCGHKCIYEDDPRLMPSPTIQQSTKSSSLKEMIKNSYGVNNTTKRDFVNCYQQNYNGEDEDDDDDDDAFSYSSSDLFELDHLIGINGRYREELPVFETTNMKTNQAIANGFIL